LSIAAKLIEALECRQGGLLLTPVQGAVLAAFDTADLAGKEALLGPFWAKWRCYCLELHAPKLTAPICKMKAHWCRQPAPDESILPEPRLIAVRAWGRGDVQAFYKATEHAIHGCRGFAFSNDNIRHGREVRQGNMQMMLKHSASGWQFLGDPRELIFGSNPERS
jgi:hypothetical protein